MSSLYMGVIVVDTDTAYLSFLTVWFFLNHTLKVYDVVLYFSDLAESDCFNVESNYLNYFILNYSLNYFFIN